MDYWKKILAEFLNRHNENYCFNYTNLREHQSNNEPKEYSSHTKAAPKQYPLGKNFPNTYFTYREAQCMKGFLQGQTCTEIGLQLSISQRTVEFYLINMKKKAKCQKKEELIEKIAKSEFIEHIDF